MRFKLDPADLLDFQMNENGIPKPEKEVRFHPKRKWRFDRAWPAKKVAIEIEGGTFVRGRHTRGIGYAKDCEKYNTAQKLGWKVYRFTTDMINSGQAIKFILEP